VKTVAILCVRYVNKMERLDPVFPYLQLKGCPDVFACQTILRAAIFKITSIEFRAGRIVQHLGYTLVDIVASLFVEPAVPPMTSGAEV